MRFVCMSHVVCYENICRCRYTRNEQIIKYIFIWWWKSIRINVIIVYIVGIYVYVSTRVWEREREREKTKRYIWINVSVLTVLFGAHSYWRCGGPLATLRPGCQPYVVQCIRIQIGQFIWFCICDAPVRFNFQWLKCVCVLQQAGIILIVFTRAQREREWKGEIERQRHLDNK